MSDSQTNNAPVSRITPAISQIFKLEPKETVGAIQRPPVSPDAEHFNIETLSQLPKHTKQQIINLHQATERGPLMFPDDIAEDSNEVVIARTDKNNIDPVAPEIREDKMSETLAYQETEASTREATGLSKPPEPKFKLGNTNEVNQQIVDAGGSLGDLTA